MPYTQSQQVALALVPKLTGTLGMASSMFIISEITRDFRNKESNPIKRALLAITVYEIMDTFGWWLSSWALPSDSDFVFASGNRASCNFQGFLLQMAIGAPLNNALLTSLFYLIVTKGYDNQKLQSIELKAHVGVFVFAFGSSILLLSLKQYNPINHVCWVNGSPSGCSESAFGGANIYDEDYVPCERGENAFFFGVGFFYVLVWIAIASVTVMNIKMRHTLIKKKSADVGWITTQAMLYSLAFIVTWTPSTLWSIFNWFGGGGFWLDLLACIFEPLQGFFNCMIFIRNRPEAIERLRRIFACKCLSSSADDDDKENDTGVDTTGHSTPVVTPPECAPIQPDEKCDANVEPPSQGLPRH